MNKTNKSWECVQTVHVIFLVIQLEILLNFQSLKFYIISKHCMTLVDMIEYNGTAAFNYVLYNILCNLTAKWNHCFIFLFTVFVIKTLLFWFCSKLIWWHKRFDSYAWQLAFLIHMHLSFQTSEIAKSVAFLNCLMDFPTCIYWYMLHCYMSSL